MIHTVEGGQMTKDLALLISPEQPWQTSEQFLATWPTTSRSIWPSRADQPAGGTSRSRGSCLVDPRDDQIGDQLRRLEHRDVPDVVQDRHLVDVRMCFQEVFGVAGCGSTRSFSQMTRFVGVDGGQFHQPGSSSALTSS